MSLIIDAILDVLPKRKIPPPPPLPPTNYLEKLREEEEEKMLLNNSKTPPQIKKVVVPQQPVKQMPQQQPEPEEEMADETDVGQQSETEKEVAVEDIIVEIYKQIIELRKDVNALIGLNMRRE